MSEWTFITTHAAVLSLIPRNPSVTAVDLCQAVGVTERAVRKAIADLTSTGYLSKTKEGRRVRYRVNRNLFLRHPSHREVEISDFLRALGWKDEGEKGVENMSPIEERRDKLGVMRTDTPC